MGPGHHRRRGPTAKCSFRWSCSALSHSHSSYTQKNYINSDNINKIISGYTHAQPLTKYCYDPHRRHQAGRAVRHAGRCTGQLSHIFQRRSGTFQWDRNIPPHTPSPPHSRPQPQTERGMSGHTHSHRPRTLGPRGTPTLTKSNQVLPQLVICSQSSCVFICQK